MSAPVILFISGSMPLGGGSTSILNLCDGLRSEGTWEPHVAVVRKTGAVGEQIIARGHQFHGPCTGLIHEDRMEQMLMICREIKPRVIVAALGIESFDFMRYVPSDCLRIAMVQSDDPGLYRYVSTYAEWIDVVVAVSLEIYRRTTEAIGSNRASVSYQPYGVPMPEAAATPIRANALRVLYLGRVEEEQKRIGLMMRIMRKTLESDCAIQWTVAGDGDLLPGMRKEFADQPEEVTCLGPVPYAEVPGLFKRHDVYFLCSNYEGLPLSLLEAMGGGLVPVVSDLPSGISEVVDSINGIRIPTNDESGYVQALIYLCENRCILDGMSESCIDVVNERFSVGAMTKRWLDMIDENNFIGIPDWSNDVTIHAPLLLEHRIIFRPEFRMIRRAIKRIHRE